MNGWLKKNLPVIQKEAMTVPAVDSIDERQLEILKALGMNVSRERAYIIGVAAKWAYDWHLDELAETPETDPTPLILHDDGEEPEE